MKLLLYELLWCVLVVQEKGFSSAVIVSDHLSTSDPDFSGILATNAFHSRQRRALAIVRGSSFAVAWCLTFPVKSFTKLQGSFELCHLVKMPLRKLYPEIQIKGRIDTINKELILNELSKRLYERNGEILDSTSEINFEPNRLSRVYSNNGSLISDLDNMIDMDDNLPIKELESLSQIFYEEKTPEDVLRLDRLKSRQDRLYLYTDFESFLKKMGLPGRPCLLRSICEIAQHPFENSLFGEPLNILMMPSLGGKPEFLEEEDVYNTFLEAESNGRNEKNCDQEYKKCSTSVFFLLYEFIKQLF